MWDKWGKSAVFSAWVALTTLGIFSCGDGKTLSISYSHSAAGARPELIVVLTEDAEGTFKQNIEMSKPGGTSLYLHSDDPRNLRNCAANPISGETACNSLKLFFQTAERMENDTEVSLFPLTVTEDALSERSFGVETGTVYVLFFYNSDLGPNSGSPSEATGAVPDNVRSFRIASATITGKSIQSGATTQAQLDVDLSEKVYFPF